LARIAHRQYHLSGALIGDHNAAHVAGREAKLEHSGGRKGFDRTRVRLGVGPDCDDRPAVRRFG
jgi:hypothetical protein